MSEKITEIMTAALSLPPYFEPSERFSEIFYEFDAALTSLQRYSYFVLETQSLYNSALKTILTIREVDTNFDHETDAAEIDFLGDVHHTDAELFTDWWFGGILSHLLTRSEQLVAAIAHEKAVEVGLQVELPASKMPYIHQYIVFFERLCGFTGIVSKENRRILDRLQALRNAYVHKQPIQRTPAIAALEEELSMIVSGERIDTRPLLLDLAFRTIADIARQLEKAYWNDDT